MAGYRWIRLLLEGKRKPPGKEAFRSSAIGSVRFLGTLGQSIYRATPYSFASHSHGFLESLRRVKMLVERI